MTQEIKLIGIITLSFVMASMANVYPLPPFFAMMRPMFLIMVLVFWVMYQPRWIGVGVAFVVGLGADLLLDTHLGHQAFCAVAMTFGLRLATGFTKRMDAARAWLLGGVGLTGFCVLLWLMQSVAHTKLVFTGMGSWFVSVMGFPVLSWLLIRITRRFDR